MKQFPIEIIIDSLEGRLSKEETAKLKVWLTTSIENQKFYDETKRVFENTAKARISFNPDKNKALQKVNRRLQTKQIVRWSYRVAAVFVLVFLISRVFLISAKTEWREIIAENQQTIFLPDSSIITLAENTSFKYPIEFNKKERSVVLNGKAYFEVTKDAKCPFIISTSNTEIKVLGTLFLVDASNPEKEQVFVDEGKIAFSVQNNNYSSVILTKNEKGIWQKNQNNILESTFQNLNQNSWLSGHLAFNNSALKAVISDFEQHYKIKIELSDKTIENRKYTGKFSNVPSQEAMQVLCLSLNLTFKKNKNIYILNP